MIRISVVHDGRVGRIQGWFSIPETSADHVGFACNGVPFGEVRIVPSADLDREFNFSFWPDRPAYDFEASIALEAMAAGPRGYEIAGVDRRTGEPLFPNLEVNLTADWTSRIRHPLPPDEQVGRNYRMGPTNRLASLAKPGERETTFFFSGSSHLFMLDRAMRAAVGRGVEAAGRVLDWGCGVGRLTQHLSELPGCEVHGADIDAENVAWATSNIRHAQFRTISLDPPTPYPDGFFDLVIAISVFTHLSEEAQFAWLRELRRIVKPGGAIAVTVAGWHTFRRRRLRNVLNFVRDLDRAGFSDSTIGNLLAPVLGEESTYYRNTKHMPEYVFREWAPYFDVKAMKAGALGGQQDIVVALRP